MAPSPVRARFANSESVFKPDIFKGKVLFCTGGGSGICKEMTYAMVRTPSSLSPFLYALIWTCGAVDETRSQRNDCRKKVGPLLRPQFDVSRELTGQTACRLDRLTQAAEELSKGTGNTCIPAQGDVRKPDELKEAVRKTIEKFGRIDFVICGESKPPVAGWNEASI